MTDYVYHFKPKGMHGKFLMPLNKLKTDLPDIYDEQVKKYKGREFLLQEELPILNCLWNDVLHISPINPQIIIDTWRKEGLYEFARVPSEIEVYKIPTAILLEETAVCFQTFNFDYNNNDPALDKFWLFKGNEFIEQKEVEKNQLMIWRRDFENGRRFFWYSHTMHILAKQVINTDQCELIICR